MNNGLLLFLGILAAMMSSWFGFVHTPQVQFGNLLPERDEITGATFPSPRSGSANRGRAIYRENGCASCHTQQVRQEGYDFSVSVSDFGTNTVDVSSVLAGLSESYTQGSPLPAVPYKLAEGVDLREAEQTVKKLSNAGAAARALISVSGSDIERGWGIRRTVGSDYLLDAEVMLGSVRIGPDLANLGNRNSDSNWHYVHLFQPRQVVEDSVMPSYAYLFDKRPVNGVPDADALRYDGELVTDAEGRQVIPRNTAKELVAYLLSLRLDEPVFEAPAPEQEKKATPSEDAETEASPASSE